MNRCSHFSATPSQPLLFHTAGFFVLVQVAFERERFPTAQAYVRLHTRVCLSVGAQIGFVGKRLTAELASERPFAGVGANVALQQPRA